MMIYMGGPAYRNQVDSNHCATMARMASMFTHTETSFTIDYENDAILPFARERLLRRAMKSEADFLISMDSDVYWLPDFPMASFRRFFDHWHHFPHVAIHGAVVPRQDGLPNTWTAFPPSFEVGPRLLLERPVENLEVHAIGTGFVVYNLDWYRHKSRPHHDWFPITFDDDDNRLGEDTSHSCMVRIAGGKIVAHPSWKCGNGRAREINWLEAAAANERERNAHNLMKELES